ncbi:F-box/FBD/LRR-repeat protein [Pyrus ussuriensis x Pyrus communis]|uniref:F-box/FBD/LRR-repeat protein n=1 Tax=Pyrus ussuriensis x Pyrus communis TaxID=2448454 RepID=A0A5N5FCU0_9ROSA|nr:F-box/FBD/LRR-repeat protein [Pyrus ussuriensis x Pyrus communis]
MNKRGWPASQFSKSKNEHNFGTRGKATKRGKNLGAKEKNKGKCNAVGKISRRLPNSLLFSLFMLTGAASARNFYRRSRDMPKRKKKNLGIKEKNKGQNNNLVDRISQLPDEILSSIVSLLPLKEAAATSILSRRWQYVWSSTMNLDLDAKFELGEYLFHFMVMEPELKDQEQHRYVNWVDNVVEQHRGPVIEHFRACFYVDFRFSSLLDKWIQFAMNNRVQVLELVFYLEFCNRISDDLYPFPHKLLGLENVSTSKLKDMHSDIPQSPLHNLHSIDPFSSSKMLQLTSIRTVLGIYAYQNSWFPLSISLKPLILFLVP